MSEHQEIVGTEFGTGQKTLKAYIVGFALCILLTLVPFALIIKRSLSEQYLYIALAVFALVQLYVQVVFFLRLNTSSKGRWNLMSFLFTILIIVCIVGGSLWIMHNLDYHMAH